MANRTKINGYDGESATKPIRRQKRESIPQRKMREEPIATRAKELAKPRRQRTTKNDML